LAGHGRAQLRTPSFVCPQSPSQGLISLVYQTFNAGLEHLVKGQKKKTKNKKQKTNKTQQKHFSMFFITSSYLKTFPCV